MQLNKDYYIRPGYNDDGVWRRARVIWINRSKYVPHQGKRECERRVRQMSR